MKALSLQHRRHQNKPIVEGPALSLKRRCTIRERARRNRQMRPTASRDGVLCSFNSTGQQFAIATGDGRLKTFDTGENVPGDDCPSGGGRWHFDFVVRDFASRPLLLELCIGACGRLGSVS